MRRTEQDQDRPTLTRADMAKIGVVLFIATSLFIFAVGTFIANTEMVMVGPIF